MTDDDFDQFETDAPTAPRARKAPAKRAAKKPAPRKAPARKRVPPTAPEPQDFKPKAQTGASARKAEADATAITISVCGIDIQVERDQGEWPLAALDNFAEGRHIAGAKLLIGPVQWQAILDAGAKVKDMNGFASRLSQELGITDSGY